MTGPINFDKLIIQKLHSGTEESKAQHCGKSLLMSTPAYCNYTGGLSSLGSLIRRQRCFWHPPPPKRISGAESDRSGCKSTCRHLVSAECDEPGRGVRVRLSVSHHSASGSEVISAALKWPLFLFWYCFTFPYGTVADGIVTDQ